MAGNTPPEGWAFVFVLLVLAFCLVSYPFIMTRRRRPDRGDALPLSHNERMLADAPLAELTELVGYEVSVQLIQEVKGITSKVVDMFVRLEVLVPELGAVVIEKLSANSLSMNPTPGTALYQLIPGWFLIAEDQSVRLLTLTPDVVDAFERAMAYPSPWSGAYVARGVWTFSMDVPPKTSRETVREQVLGALGYVEAVLDALRREQRSDADILAQWANRTDSPDLTYDAVRLLAQKHPNSSHLAELRAAFDTVHATVRYALVSWDDGLDLDRDTRIGHLRGLGKVMPHKASLGYAHRFPWTMVADDTHTVRQRLIAAEHVFDDPDAPTDPAARDARLIACFNAKAFNEHARFYSALREGGWEPTLPTRLHLIDRGHRDMAKLMLAELRAQDTFDGADVAVLEALGQEGHAVSDLLKRARRVAGEGGQLSLVHDPEAAGALTQAADTGGLELKEE